MKLRALVIPAVLLLAVAGGGWWWVAQGEPTVSFKTATLARTDVRKLVTATGALRAEVMVDVGTQVSGLIAELLVDFNQSVARDEVLARLDTSLLAADVASARARRAEAEATHRRKDLELTRIKALRANDAATDQELEVARAEADVAHAQLKSAEVTLQRATRNLEYATIRSPIDGVVVDRAVEVGQTVNAGFSAPTLFTLAGDLARMQILVRVDESDIGLVSEGGAVEFTVQSFPERTFTGAVRQVRLESVLDQSVVTYTVVVDVENPDKVLLPGMTATVSFVVAEAKDVLCAPNAALRFRPDDQTTVLGGANGGAGGGAAGNGGAGGAPPAGGAAVAGGAPSAGGAAGGAAGGPGSGRGGGRGRRGPTSLYVQEGEALRAIPVTVGIRGAECTEVSGEGVTEGLEVVTAMDRTADGVSNPFAPQSTSGGRRPGGI